MFELTADHAAEVVDGLHLLPAIFGKNLAEGLDYIGLTLRNDIVANAPFTDRTGLLRKSVQYEVNLGEGYVVIWPGQEYGKFLELGTGKWGPRKAPYPIPNFMGWGITVMHPGIDPGKFAFLAPALEKRTDWIHQQIATIVELSVVEAQL